MNKRKKVIAFGIGTGAKEYLKNYEHEYDIIALSDWDKNTHGLERYGYKIIDPYTFNKYDYEGILILSFYVREIATQLKERINIDEEMLIIPPKHKIKGIKLPFEHKETKEFAKYIIVKFNEIARNLNIDIFLDYGTLLGIVRDKDIIPWDDDIDFSIREEDVSTLLEYLDTNLHSFIYPDILKWKAQLRKDDYGKVYRILLQFESISDYSFNPFEISFATRSVINNQSVNIGFRNLTCDKKHFNNKSYISIWGANLIAPNNYIEYLDIVYGDWKTPKRYTFGTEYGSVGKGSIDKHLNKTREEMM